MLTTNILVTPNSDPRGDPVYTTFPPAIAANTIPFAPGDVLESPNAASQSATAITSIGNVQQSPCQGTVTVCGVLNMGAQGPGVAGSYRFIGLGNFEPGHTYGLDIAPGTINPHPSVSPPNASKIFGIFNDLFPMETMPYGYMFHFGKCYDYTDVTGMAIKGIFNLPGFGNSGDVSHLTYNCTTNTLSFDANFSSHTGAFDTLTAGGPSGVITDGNGSYPVGDFSGNIGLANHIFNAGWINYLRVGDITSVYGLGTIPTINGLYPCLSDGSNCPAGAPLTNPMGGQNNYASIASPTFTGTPSAPTATAGSNTTQIATTAFVVSAVAASVIRGTSSSVGPVTEGQCSQATVTMTGLTSTMAISVSGAGNMGAGTTVSAFYGGTNTAIINVCNFNADSVATTFNLVAQ